MLLSYEKELQVVLGLSAGLAQHALAYLRAAKSLKLEPEWRLPRACFIFQ